MHQYINKEQVYINACNLHTNTHIYICTYFDILADPYNRQDTHIQPVLLWLHSVLFHVLFSVLSSHLNVGIRVGYQSEDFIFSVVSIIVGAEVVVVRIVKWYLVGWSVWVTYSDTHLQKFMLPFFVRKFWRNEILQLSQYSKLFTCSLCVFALPGCCLGSL